MNSASDLSGEAEGSDWQRYLDWIRVNPKGKSGTSPDFKRETDFCHWVENRDLVGSIFPDIFF